MRILFREGMSLGLMLVQIARSSLVLGIFRLALFLDLRA